MKLFRIFVPFFNPEDHQERGERVRETKRHTHTHTDRKVLPEKSTKNAVMQLHSSQMHC